MKNKPSWTLCMFILAAFLFQIPAYCQEEEKKPPVAEEKPETNVITVGVVPGKFTQDYDAALKYAEEKKLPVILIFTGSDWCGWCKIMDKNVFSKPEWLEYAKDNLVQVWLDFPRKNPDLVPVKYRKRNIELQGKYQVKGYPTYVMLDCKGNKLGTLGAGRDKTPASFKAEVEKVLMMTTDGMKKFCAELKPEDAEIIMKAFTSYQESNLEKNELSEEFEALKKATEEKKEALDKAILKGRLNAMSEEERGEYEAAQKAVLKAQKDLQAWMQINGRTKPTPELRQEFNQLRKAVMEANSKLESF